VESCAATGTAPGDVLKDTDALARAKTFCAQDAPPARFPGGYTRPECDTESAAQPLAAPLGTATGLPPTESRVKLSHIVEYGEMRQARGQTAESPGPRPGDSFDAVLRSSRPDPSASALASAPELS
jgi:hypothetical protein